MSDCLKYWQSVLLFRSVTWANRASYMPCNLVIPLANPDWNLLVRGPDHSMRHSLISSWMTRSDATWRLMKVIIVFEVILCSSICYFWLYMPGKHWLLYIVRDQHVVALCNAIWIYMRAVWRVSSHFEYLENRSHGLDITWQPVRGDLIVDPWTVTLLWG
jgi:hypothetical protein